MSEGAANDGLPVRHAGFFLRVVAALIDIGIVWAFAWLVSALLGIPFLAATPEELADPTIIHVLIAVVLFAAWLYHAGLEASRMQATLGKAFMGLYVTDLRGERAGFERLSIRHWAKFVSAVIFFVGFLMAMFPPRRQALHDMLAGCLVQRR